MERKCDNENEVFRFFYGAFMKLSTTWDNYLVRAEENTFNSEKKKARSFQILPLGGIMCGHVTGNFEVPDHGLRTCVLIMIYAIFQM